MRRRERILTLLEIREAFYQHWADEVMGDDPLEDEEEGFGAARRRTYVCAACAGLGCDKCKRGKIVVQEVDSMALAMADRPRRRSVTLAELAHGELDDRRRHWEARRRWLDKHGSFRALDEALAVYGELKEPRPSRVDWLSDVLPRTLRVPAWAVRNPGVT